MGSGCVDRLASERRRDRYPKILGRLAASGDERRRLEVCRDYGVDPRTFDGEPTVERHYDADGVLTGTTVRESPWDDYARAEVLADSIRRDRIHAECGVDIGTGIDPKQAWFVDHTIVCQACATRDSVMRGLDEEHEHDPTWRDGRIVSVRPATEAVLRAANKGDFATQTR